MPTPTAEEIAKAVVAALAAKAATERARAKTRERDLQFALRIGRPLGIKKQK